MAWLFDDKPHTACFTTVHVLDGSLILRVYHDYDGAWQFHGDSSQSENVADDRVVGLSEIVCRDASLAELHDLPYGWRAERASISSEWIRSKNLPFPTFADNGYYLEDAVWLSQFLPDIKPPNEGIRENLSVGEYVKLVFRFAAEESDRHYNECERMWVAITEQNDDGHYHGTIENDPHHEAAKCGDSLVFHPLHVADIYEGE